MNNLNKKIEIIGISGKLGSGKNYVTENIIQHLLTPKKTLLLAFADDFKIETITKDNLSYERVFIKKDSESREKLQNRGTKEGREKYGENIWVDTLEQWIRLYSERGIERFIILDIRFINEAELVKKLGGIIIRINAPDRTMDKYIEETNNNHDAIQRISNHISETELDNYTKFDYYVNNTKSNEKNIFNDIEKIITNYNKKNIYKTTIFFDLDDTLIECHKYYDMFIDTNFYKVLVPYISTFDLDISNLYSQYEGIVHNLKYNTDYFRTPYTIEKFPNLLVNSAKELLTVNNIKLDNTILCKVYEHGMMIHNIQYESKSGALDYVFELSKLRDYNIVICTVGDRLSQMKKILYHNLQKYNIEISTFKNKDLYINLMQKYKSENYIIVGDSAEREIIPAYEANFDKCIHILNTTTKKLDNLSNDKYYAYNNVIDIPFYLFK